MATLSAVGVAFAVLPAGAQEPDGTPRPAVMLEPGEVVDVIDAFDDDDPFDANVSLGFEYTTKHARVLRETTIYQPGLTTGGYTSHMMNVADYYEMTSRLIPRVDLGIYKDLAFYIRFPIVLSNERKLEAIDDGGGNLAAALQGAPGETLFSLPFQAPNRSGLEFVALGLNVNILNQARDQTKPTWLLGIEAQLSPGDVLRACNANPPNNQVQCADPSDYNRNGRYDSDLEGAPGTPLEGAEMERDLDAGVSRGMFGLQIHTLMSKRVKYVEPYGGFTALFEFPMGTNPLDTTELEATLVNHPPLIGTVTLGMMFIPWEYREKFARLTLDVRFQGEYHSEGRDYSELFDALGSSDVESLRVPKWARYRDNCPGGPCEPGRPKSVIDETSQRTYFNGMTVVEAFGSYRMSGSVTWQAMEYFKITGGFGVRWDQGHGITHDQPCNPDFKDDVGQSGPCHLGDIETGPITATGIPNPAYRAPINAIGRRFYVDESVTVDVFFRGVVMF